MPRRRNRGLIRRGISRFLTQTGQLCRTAYSEFGDTNITSVYTISLLVYQEVDQQVQSSPAVTRLREHLALVSDATTIVRKGDIIRTVVDLRGLTVLDEARVLSIDDWDHWQYGRRFRRLVLDVDLDG